MTFRRVGLLVSATVLAAGCNKPLLVGVVLPETGSASVIGKSEKQGVQLAFKEAKEGGLLPKGLTVDYADSGSSASQAAKEAKGLYDRGALVVIGGATTESAQAILPIANREEKLLISPSASAGDLAKKSIFFFRLCPSDDVEGAQVVKILTRNGATNSVLIIEEDSAYAHSMLPVVLGGLRSHNVTVVGPIITDEPKWKQKVRDTVVGHQPDAAFVCGCGEMLVAAVQALRQADFQGTICTNSGIAAREIIKEGGGALNGVMFPMVAVDMRAPDRPLIKEFVDHFTVAYGVEPDVFAAEGHDSALAAIYALKGLRTRSGQEVQLRMKGLEQDWGVTGALAFDDLGNIQHYPRTYWIHDGRIEDFEKYLEQEKRKLQEKFRELLKPQGGGS